MTAGASAGRDILRKEDAGLYGATARESRFSIIRVLRRRTAPSREHKPMAPKIRRKPNIADIVDVVSTLKQKSAIHCPMLWLNKETMMRPNLSRFIDMSRWMAAFAVLVTHVNANAGVMISDIPGSDRGPLAYIVWFFYGFAHQAVVVFFVLSGFLVGGNALKAARAPQSFLGRYLTDRTVRIYVVLIPALLVTAVLDGVGRRLFADTGIYALPIFADRSSGGILLANLVNIQDMYAPYFGTDSALWTLAHEYWYYVTFGLLIMPLAMTYRRSTRWICFALGSCLLLGLSASLSYHLFGFMLWLAGAAAATLGTPLLRSRRTALAAFIAAAVAIRLCVRYSALEIWWIGGLADAAVASLFANLLLTLRFDEKPDWAFCKRAVHKTMAEFSYSLYAIHMPIVVFLCAASQHVLGYGFHSVPTSSSRWVLEAAVLATAVAIAYGFYLLSEARTGAVRAFVRKTIEALRPPDRADRRSWATGRNAADTAR